MKNGKKNSQTTTKIQIFPNNITSISVLETKWFQVLRHSIMFRLPLTKIPIYFGTNLNFGVKKSSFKEFDQKFYSWGAENSQWVPAWKLLFRKIFLTFSHQNIGKKLERVQYLQHLEKHIIHWFSSIFLLKLSIT